MRSFVLYVALTVMIVDFINAKSLNTKIFRERRFSPMLNQQSSGQSGQQTANGCPAMCVRWNTVLKSNGQLENTPAVTSPLVPGDTITQCPKECEPKCCNNADPTYAHADQSKASEELQDQHTDQHDDAPACMEGCPSACYPACRPGCCNAPRMMSMYQQNMAQQTPMMQPVPQQYIPQPVAPSRETIPRSALLSYTTEEEPVEERDTVPVAPYAEPQLSPVRSYIPSPSELYSQFPQSETTSYTRATIPEPVSSNTAGHPDKQRDKVPQSTATTCPVPCSPMCAPHCSKHCCESYD